MGKKITLPVLGDRTKEPTQSKEQPRSGDAKRTTKKPSLDDARARLGGPSRGAAPPVGVAAGRIVTVTSSTSGTPGSLLGVVVFANADEVHVLVDGVRLRRLAPNAVTLFEGDAPLELAKIAADAHLFATLVEGQPVRYADDTTGLTAGKLAEKCRYGGLVVRSDGTVVAVGFRKLWPGTSSGNA